MSHNVPIREKNHRLPKELYKGRVSASFTLCLQHKAAAFTEPDVVSFFSSILSEIITTAHCTVPVYCFMPDHQHILLTGTSDESDLLKTVIAYKQKTGYWLSSNMPEIKWQKDFFDHIIRSDENLAVQVRYILDNPVRKGFAVSWQDYPYKGSIGYDLNTVVNGIL